MRRLLTEPLGHFLLLGAALFAIYTLKQPAAAEADDSAPREIVVTAGRIEALTANFAKMWHRSPTTSELAGLIEDFVKGEIYYREALALGLERDDTIIRRRLRQKMEFISVDPGAATEPTDEQLQALLTANPEAYRQDAVLSFEHIFIDPTRHAQDLDTVLQDLRVQLVTAKATPDITNLGDRLSLESSYTDLTTSAIDRLFGPGFGASLESLPLDTWSEPQRSGYGLHFVRVIACTPNRIPELTEVRLELERDWQFNAQQKAEQTFYQSLRDRYTVTIEE